MSAVSPAELGNPNRQSSGRYREDGGVRSGREPQLRVTGANGQDGVDNPDRPPEPVASPARGAKIYPLWEGYPPSEIPAGDSRRRSYPAGVAEPSGTGRPGGLCARSARYTDVVRNNSVARVASSTSAATISLTTPFCRGTKVSPKSPIPRRPGGSSTWTPWADGRLTGLSG